MNVFASFTASSLLAGTLLATATADPATKPATPAGRPDATILAMPVVRIEPPEKEFFSKKLEFEGIPIKAHADVADEALREAAGRLAMMLKHLPTVRENLRDAGAALHIIGRNQGTSDLPEWKHMKGKPFDGRLTIDQRTRGMGGRLTSCGEENLLRLPDDRYRGRDICVHEFAHNIYNRGVPNSIRDTFRARYREALAEGLWVGSYAGSNHDEFFAETTMWYFGTRGDLRMKGPKPESGREGLRAYDPKTLALLDEFYGGKMDIPRLPPRTRRGGER
jgi:alpha-glucosidase